MAVTPFSLTVMHAIFSFIHLVLGFSWQLQFLVHFSGPSYLPHSMTSFFCIHRNISFLLPHHRHLFLVLHCFSSYTLFKTVTQRATDRSNTSPDPCVVPIASNETIHSFLRPHPDPFLVQAVPRVPSTSPVYSVEDLTVSITCQLTFRGARFTRSY